MAAPIVIKSSDPGTPVINGVVWQMIVFFDEILVSRLGWTKAFSEVDKAVYYPATSIGNKLFYRISNAAGTSAAGTVQRISVTTYESMTDVDTGIGASVPLYILVSGDKTTTGREWEVVGDGYGLHLRIKPMRSGDVNWQWHYLGEGLPFFSNDMWFSLITGSFYNSSNPDDDYSEALQYKQSSNGNDDIRVARRLSGSVGSVSSAFYPAGTSYYDRPIGTNYITYAYPTDGKLLYTHPYINDGAVRTIRGHIPGLYAPEHGSGLTHGQEYPIDGKLLRYYGWITSEGRLSNRFCSLFIDISAGYRP